MRILLRALPSAEIGQARRLVERWCSLVEAAVAEELEGDEAERFRQLRYEICPEDGLSSSEPSLGFGFGAIAESEVAVWRARYARALRSHRGAVEALLSDHGYVWLSDEPPEGSED